MATGSGSSSRARVLLTRRGILTRWVATATAAIGGTSALGYAAQLAHLPFQARAGKVVLILGTNDIIRKAKPLSPETSGRFAAAAARLLVWLRGNADRVLVAAVPPIGPVRPRRRTGCTSGITPHLRLRWRRCCPVLPLRRGRAQSGQGLTEGMV